MNNDRHILSVQELEKALCTDLSDGLSIREARVRLPEEKKRDGGERFSLFVPKKSNYLALALSFFATPGIIILIVISLLAALFGSLLTGVSVMLLSVAGAIVGGLILQSSRRNLDSMMEFASPMLKVKRGGNTFHTDGRNIVTGDIIILSQGDLLPCDARIISSRTLIVKELINTKNGIRNRVVRKDHSIEYTDRSVKAPDVENMLYAGSAILSGDAVCVVVATGKNTYLSRFLPEGALAGGERADASIEWLKPTLYRVSFFSIAALAVLSLLSIVTLKGTSFVSSFLMLLSSIAMISLEIIRMGRDNIFSAVIDRLARTDAKRKKKDCTAFLRGASATETLNRVTNVALLGRAALYDGILHVDSACVSAKGEVISTLDPNDTLPRRILTCVNTYLKALRDSGVSTDLVRDGVAESLREYLKAVGFDASGASLVLQSLYFAGDSSGKNGYACAETAESEYRVVISLEENVLSLCEKVRSRDGQRAERLVLDGAYRNYIDNVRQNGGRCLFVVSETNREAVLEGVLALYEKPAQDIEGALGELTRMSAKTTVMLLEEDKNILDEPTIAPLFEGEIAFASDFSASGKKITDDLNRYCAYMGFSAEEYAQLVLAMRQSGEVVAAYGIDNAFYDVMSRADIAVSSDTVRYSSPKYRESVYERLACEGRDSNVRCSQMTRLLSKVIVHRTNTNGGGLLAISNAIRRSRAAYISFAYSILFFAAVICSLISIAAMSAILGIQLINAVQACCLSLVFGVLSMSVFADAQPKLELLYSKKDFSLYPSKILSEKLPYIISRIGLSCVIAVTVKVLDVLGVFGAAPSYTMPIFISLLLIGAVELFIVNLDFTRRGEGRGRSFTRFLIAYAVVLVVGGVITQNFFAAELFPNGIGTLEFLIVPAFCILYPAVAFSVRAIEKKRK